MADHIRKQIRDIVAAQLAGLTTTGDRVFVGRSRPLGAEHAPSLLVYMRTETGRRATMDRPPKSERSCTLFVEGRVVTADAPDDLLDQIAAEVEARMGDQIEDGPPRRILGGLAQNLVYVGTEIIAEADNKNHTGGIRLEYAVTYRVTEGAPTATA
ncbi:hypothetical protein HL667_00040 [Bradyrhizobium sp. 83012]|uniref:Tail terminator n=1 Tax=Bradyrhizobium aeschynomenes TaxID=2734909 RepID=A0ABX2C6W5_9BRAD|nr:hypothetical protein [Bradyrhizobium aeschynomenes]NPU63385.1 hypothetical protein [Bradyrhizobium aeschynomenes]